jgi:diguanylate cyclase (GGDEF)-like protein
MSDDAFVDAADQTLAGPTGTPVDSDGSRPDSRFARPSATQSRERTTSARLHGAAERDRAAHVRDLAALARDQAALARDRAMAQQEARDEDDGALRAMTGADIVARAAEERRCAAEHRARAAEHRALAAADRAAAARDREHAARDRRQARADREILARELTLRETDPLTGARTRAAGLVELNHELSRCRRTDTSLVIAHVDVIGLKVLNETEGHGAGDELLARLVAVLRQQLRPYDLVVRVGDDEFLCAMPGMTRAYAERRFGQIAAALAAPRTATAIRTGFADMTPDDTVAKMIARAAGDLLERREPLPR